MAFITRNDYPSVIDDHVLSEVVRFDDNRLATSELRAIAFAKSHLNARYDVATIFEQEDEDRHPLVLMHCLNISLFYLHQLVATDQIPQTVLDNYVEAKDWFEGINKGIINDPDLPVFTDGSRDFILYGGNTKRDNHI